LLFAAFAVDARALFLATNCSSFAALAASFDAALAATSRFFFPLLEKLLIVSAVPVKPRPANLHEPVHAPV